ncbi:MAG: ABC transporter substrate-binding protein [Thermomicrobiales bacterium]
MDSEPSSPIGYINRGIDAYERHEIDVAKRQFALALLGDPHSEMAWLWLAEVSEEAGERLYCLNRAVEIEPDSKGRRRRNALRHAGVSPAVPPVITDIEKPRTPPSLATAAEPTRQPLRLRIDKLRSRAAGSVPLDGETTPLHPKPGGRRWPMVIAALLALATVLSLILIANQPGASDVFYVAVAGPMSGDDAPIGEQVRNSAIIARDDFNATVVRGPRMDLIFFDDRNDPDLARTVAQEIVDQGRFVGVIGHGTSSTSLAAAPIYQAAGMPVITAQATIDSLSQYPGYFRTIFTNSTEATILAEYLPKVLGQQRVSIVAGDSDYEASLAEEFAKAFAGKGTIAHTWTISGDRAASVASIVAAMKSTDDVGMVFLAATDDNGHEFMLQLRRAGLETPVMGSETLGSESFAASVAELPEAQDTPGYFTNEMYAVSPLLYVSVGGDTLAFAQEYARRHGVRPGWRGPKTWDAVTALGVAAQRAHITEDRHEIGSYRSAVIAQLRGMNSQTTAFRGLAGPLYFTSEDDSPQGFSVGQFENGRLSSAPSQYRLVTNLTEYNMNDEVAAGRAIALNGYYIRLYRVVYVGVDMIELRDLSTADQSYTADFFIYFRYNGDDAPLNIAFTNAQRSDLSLGTAINASTTATGMNYRLFRVQGTFTEPMAFQDYPWDRHQLTIRFQNPEYTQTDIVYVPDPSSLAKTQAARQLSGFDLSRPFNRVPSWEVTSVMFEQDAITTEADDYDTQGLVQYSEFRTVIDTRRDVNRFLIKNLLPLVLLTLVTYIAIWFPAEQAGARVGFAITALLSSAVMLNAIASQLPDIGYTVAIEWGYYVYIGLSAILVLLTIAVDRSYKAKRFARVRRLDIAIRTLYPLAILAAVLIYAWTYYWT